MPEPKNVRADGLAVHEDVRMSPLDEPADVDRSIRMILSTAPGEREGQPEYGCRLHDLVYEPAIARTAAQAAMRCEAAIKQFEPRVEYVSCRGSFDPDMWNQLDVHVRYLIAGESDTRELVFSLFLREPAKAGFSCAEARQLLAAFDRIVPADTALEQFDAMYRRRQAIARLDESSGEPYSEPSLHAAFEWLLTTPISRAPADSRHEGTGVDDAARDAMRRALANVDPDLLEEFFARARLAAFDPADPASLARALQVAMLRYAERGTSDQLV